MRYTNKTLYIPKDDVPTVKKFMEQIKKKDKRKSFSAAVLELIEGAVNGKNK